MKFWAHEILSRSSTGHPHRSSRFTTVEADPADFWAEAFEREFSYRLFVKVGGVEYQVIKGEQDSEVQRALPRFEVVASASSPSGLATIKLERCAGCGMHNRPGTTAPKHRRTCQERQITAA